MRVLGSNPSGSAKFYTMKSSTNKVKITNITEQGVGVENDRGHGMFFYFCEFVKGLTSFIGTIFKVGDTVTATRTKDGIKFDK